VETYWRADLNATAALWAVNAIQEVRKQFMTVNAVEKSQLDAIATELEAGHVRELEQAVTTLQDAAVALQTGAEAYVRGV